MSPIWPINWQLKLLLPLNYKQTSKPQILNYIAMKHFQNLVVALLFLGSLSPSIAQTNDATTPLHLMKPNYPTPYVVPQKEEIKTIATQH